MSIADITQNGPFSAFPTMDRELTLIAGNGIVLHGVSGSMRLAQVGESVVFPGEESLQAELIDGPVRACNLIGRRGVLRIASHVHRGTAAVKLYNVALVLAGEFEVRVPSGPVVLNEGDGIHVQSTVDAPTLLASCRNSAVLCAVISSFVTQT